MRSALLLGPLVVLALLLPAAAQAQSATEKEARRQLEFAKTEVGQHNYEKALASADSALRLHPALYEAFVFKALAYEGLGDAAKAEGYLVAYSDLAAGPGMLPEAGEALDRLRTTEVAAGNATVGDPTVVTTALPDLQTSDLPRLPPGSESLTAWLILQQRLRAAEAQRNAGVALLAAGAGLAGLGGGMMAGAASASQTSPNDPNIESMHAAGLGALLSGAVVFAASLPLTIGSAAQAGKFKRDASNLTAAAPARPRLEAGASGLALRFP
jgi:tetratricopeptide (TPR) repeat protein